ncbi:MAG: hypothetical protein A3B11_00085 [Candidatus Taylorbacteria bacterium RIFCSPLOWO2_01_FULL_44_26]|uniref:VanZ-like domain-containing protein n=2 Tax=Candidatus Tayloriibacteriota TaxID=1817919 RepID=A0A1G2MLB8_9BACT|nr:MAG: hypothetical protein A3D50_01725 [Candidatus Taylorbacteria bacterium RIFCSPHIGHO2_02_FULL_44_12]OHA31090.1 MAG: hypothetical protein A3B11_00085 [Candidatus Taylorbacteria bacterium RIFCSPLOWO2_01_FULL_44_26]
MRSYILALVILGIVYFIHISGISGWYVWYPWLDIVAHGLAGIGIGFFVLGLMRSLIPKIKRPGLYVILGVLAFGLAWELFEIFYDIAKYPLWTRLYFLDTAKDLFMDLVGGSLVAWFLSFLRSADWQRESRVLPPIS